MMPPEVARGLLYLLIESLPVPIVHKVFLVCHCFASLFDVAVVWQRIKEIKLHSRSIALTWMRLQSRQRCNSYRHQERKTIYNPIQSACVIQSSRASSWVQMLTNCSAAGWQCLTGREICLLTMRERLTVIVPVVRHRHPVVSSPVILPTVSSLVVHLVVNSLVDLPVVSSPCHSHRQYQVQAPPYTSWQEHQERNMSFLPVN